MADIIRTPGIKEKIKKDVIEKNGFHEVTERVYEAITQAEWKEILNIYYPELVTEGKQINVDLNNETVKLI
ncbi:MAG: hypothetical protein PWP27_615 [Clostridiales bacterium]|jgi:cell division ATPase FtsA|nr:hypothetical protein [Clostridiales bacterium]MDK2932805.1 hypothetical protein [Clostridiales bacterium]